MTMSPAEELRRHAGRGQPCAPFTMHGAHVSSFQGEDTGSRRMLQY
jgi:hypothetical protein